MPALQIRNINGGEWCVRAEFPIGTSDEIPGFKTENEANEWIANKLNDWLERREQSDTAPLK